MFGSKRFEVNALRGVSLEINSGEVFGLVGPNGAGKTTLIKCLTTLLLPSGGRAWVNSYEIGKQDQQIRASLGCMLMGDRGLYWKLTGRENLHFFGALYQFNPATRRKRADELIHEFRSARSRGPAGRNLFFRPEDEAGLRQNPTQRRPDTHL